MFIAISFISRLIATVTLACDSNIDSKRSTTIEKVHSLFLLRLSTWMLRIYNELLVVAVVIIAIIIIV